MPKSPEQFTPEVARGDDAFLADLKEIERQVALFDASRNKLDAEVKLGALATLDELETTQDAAKRKQLIFRLGNQVGQFDASRNNIDRDAKLEALKLIDKLE